MASQWYYRNSSGEYGPIPSTDLKQLALDGVLLKNDLVQKVGIDTWYPARRIEGLFDGQVCDKQVRKRRRAPTPKPMEPPVADNQLENPETGLPVIQTDHHEQDEEGNETECPLIQTDDRHSSPTARVKHQEKKDNETKKTIGLLAAGLVAGGPAGLLAVGAVKLLSGVVGYKCKRCGKRGSNKDIRKKVLSRTRDVRTVTRTDSHKTPGLFGKEIGQTTRREQVEVEIVDYIAQCVCKKCGHTWEERREDVIEI